MTMRDTSFEIEIGDVPEGGASTAAASAARLSAQLTAAGRPAPLLPTCVVCSRAWAKKHLLPALVHVERALIMREAQGRGYFAVVHCHGASALVSLGIDTPSDNKIRTARAFA